MQSVKREAEGDKFTFWNFLVNGKVENYKPCVVMLI